MEKLPHVARWILCVTLFIPDAAATIGNYVIVVRYVMRGAHQSLIPLMGGVALACSLALCPVSTIALYWWLPLLLDIGCIPISAWSIANIAWLWLRDRMDRKP